MYEPRTRLIFAREGLALTRADFARMIGVSRSLVTIVETGRHEPSPEVRQRWLRALGPAAKAEWFDIEPKYTPGPKPGSTKGKSIAQLA
jgi:transcriptional regulator with XRE-family HTH domain